MDDVLVSILLPAYNEEDNILASVNSVLNQTYKSFQLIIINDGSIDRTSEIIKQNFLHDSRVVLIDKKNEGLAKSLNRGLYQAEGKWIARIDADDCWHKNKLKEQMFFLSNNEDIVLLGCNCINHFLNRGTKQVTKLPLTNEKIKKYFSIDNPFIHSSVIFDTQKIKELGGYKTNVHYEDYDLWLRVAKKFKVANLSKPLVKRREDNNFENRELYRNKKRSDFFKEKLIYQLKSMVSFGGGIKSFIGIIKTTCRFLYCKVAIKL